MAQSDRTTTNATMTNVKGFLHENPDLTLTIDRADLENIMMGVKTFASSIEDGTAEAEGDVGLLSRIAGTLVSFQIGFEILPGTGSGQEVEQNPYEVSPEHVFQSGE